MHQKIPNLLIFRKRSWNFMSRKKNNVGMYFMIYARRMIFSFLLTLYLISFYQISPEKYTDFDIFFKFQWSLKGLNFTDANVKSTLQKCNLYFFPKNPQIDFFCCFFNEMRQMDSNIIEILYFIKIHIINYENY